MDKAIHFPRNLLKGRLIGLLSLAAIGCSSNASSGRGSIIAQWSPAGQAACDKAGIARVRASDSLGAAEAACADGSVTLDANPGLNALSLIGLDANGAVVAAAPSRTLLVVSDGVQPSGIMVLSPGATGSFLGDAGSTSVGQDGTTSDADSDAADTGDGFVKLTLSWNLDSDPGATASCFIHGVQTVRILLYSLYDPAGVDAPLLTQDAACAVGSASLKVPPGTYGVGVQALNSNGQVALLVNGGSLPVTVTAPGTSVISLVKPSGSATLNWSIVDNTNQPVDCGAMGIGTVSALLSAPGTASTQPALSCGAGSGTYVWTDLAANKYQLAVSALSKYGDTYAPNPPSVAFEIKAMDALNVALPVTLRKTKSGQNGTITLSWTLGGQPPTAANCGNANVQISVTDTQQQFVMNTSANCTTGKKSLTMTPGMRVLQIKMDGLPNGGSASLDGASIEVFPDSTQNANYDLTPSP